jgi:hypothetical protein
MDAADGDDGQHDSSRTARLREPRVSAMCRAAIRDPTGTESDYKGPSGIEFAGSDGGVECLMP